MEFSQNYLTGRAGGFLPSSAKFENVKAMADVAKNYKPRRAFHRLLKNGGCQNTKVDRASQKPNERKEK
jgi:hypothetical protein